VVVEGGPGIGKTRLAQEAALLARGGGVLVLAGRCRENGGRPPLWPWIEALSRLVESSTTTFGITSAAGALPGAHDPEHRCTVAVRRPDGR
jgi:predicted ATPase